MKLEQERSTVTPTSTHTASVKAVITLITLQIIKNLLSLQCTTYRKAAKSANKSGLFLYPAINIYGFMSPVSAVNAPTAFRCSATGQRETVFYFIHNKFYNNFFLISYALH